MTLNGVDTELVQEPAPVVPKPPAAMPVAVSAGFVAWMCFLTCVGTLVLGYFGLKFASVNYPALFSGGITHYVFVDEDRLYALKLKESMTRPGMSVEQAQQAADAFQTQMTHEIAQIGKSGKTVLTKQAVLAGGHSSDVTDQVAAAMGLKP